jgi:UPF0716 family protein affecting phage T7 exclusion
MRKLAIAAVVLLIMVGAISTAFGLLVLRPLPSIDADERLLGLDERVEVLRDTYGVPHSFATDTHDDHPDRPERSAVLAALGRPDATVGEREYKPMALSRDKIGKIEGKLVLRAR